MTVSLSTALVTSKNELNKTSPLVWLYRLQIDSSNAFRFASYQSNVTTYEGSAAPYTATSYAAFPISHPSIDSDQNGTLVSMTLEVSNISRELISYIEANDITSKEVRIRLADTANLGDTSNATAFFIDNKYYILGVDVGAESASIEIGHYSLLRKRCPSQVYNRNRCRWVFGSAECAFPTTTAVSATGSLNGYNLSQVSTTTCDLGFDTANGCKAHGALAKATGLAVLWPRRFGGQPGIVKGKGY